MVTILLLAGGHAFCCAAAQSVERPVIKKLGTIDCDMVETNPVVFAGKLYRFEYVRADRYKPNTTGDSYFRFIDVATGAPTPAFAEGRHLGSAFVHGDTVYAFGVDKWGGHEIRVFWAKGNLGDTIGMVSPKFQSQVALDLPGWEIFNNSVCFDGTRYVMAIEIGAPPEETGVPFTMRFAVSENARDWKLTPGECVYTKDRYSACPDIHFLDGHYYMVYLESFPGYYAPSIVRSKDLAAWETSPFNPIMKHSDEDRNLKDFGDTIGMVSPKSPAERARIATAVNINNSDIGAAEFEGKTVLYYSWGDQQGTEHLAEAVYEGPIGTFLKGFFPGE